MGDIDWGVVLTLIVILVGLAGTVIPLLPGIPVIFLAMLVYDWVMGFSVLGPYFLLIMLALTIISLLADYLSGILGAQKFGASTSGKIGAVIGGIIAFFIAGPVGIFLGPLLGVIIGELIVGKKWKEALWITWGTFLGILAGVAARLIIGSIMVVGFLMKVL